MKDCLKVLTSGLEEWLIRQRTLILNRMEFGLPQLADRTARAGGGLDTRQDKDLDGASLHA